MGPARRARVRIVRRFVNGARSVSDRQVPTEVSGLSLDVPSSRRVGYDTVRQQEVRDALRKEPFQPFRIHLSNGHSYDIRHPEFAALTRRTVFVGVSSGRDDVPDRMIECDLLHVVALEPIDGVST